MIRICEIIDCNTVIHAKGKCRKHYDQYRKYGCCYNRNSFTPNEIIKTNHHAEIIIYHRRNEEKCRAIIDLKDVDKIKNFKWNFSGGYIRTTSNSHILHGFIIDYPKSKQIDHINHNTLDNRKCNLRIVTPSQNQMNRKNVCGIWFDKVRGKWCAQIKLNQKIIYLGRFSLRFDALKARKKAEIKYFGKYSYKRGSPK